MQKGLYALFMGLFLVACASDGNYAPVTELTGSESVPKSGLYRVRTGETLYAIAWRYGLDYRTLAGRNHIEEPYTIRPGELIYLRGKKKMIASAEVSKIPPSISPLPQPSLNVVFTNQWVWPAKGQVQKFSVGHKGINILGEAGTPVYAAAGGKVVYSGDGLRGYGNLIIVKHSDLYLSAYAHNKTVFVIEGQVVQQGQKIAEMGSTGTDHTMLHFEIRRAGKPIDPLSVLS